MLNNKENQLKKSQCIQSKYLNYLPSNKRSISYLTLSEDVWDASSLGLKILHYNSRKKLVFLYIYPEIFKEVAKKFIRYQSTRKQLTTLLNHIQSFNKFSDFLLEFYPNIDLNKVDRAIIIEYISWLSSKGLSYSTKCKALSSLKQLFFISSINKWLDIPDNLICPEDWGKPTQTLPRYIPEEVIKQLNEHLDNLPKPIMRMILVLQECGLRIGELCLLQFNCLKQDSKGDWYIQFMRWKMKTETILPISHELAKVIQEQQEYIKKSLDINFKYLFSGGTYKYKSNTFFPAMKVMNIGSFTKYLKKFAERFDIKDNSGKKWNFQTHQFRHTVGTKMINNGIPHHIVQRYLGHTSPKMTEAYAHIHDETLKQEIAKYHDSRTVNITGKVADSQTLELDNDLDLHLFRKRVLAQSLPNGSCARPIQLGECPHANACLTCGDFRTTIEFLDEHKKQLQETRKIIKIAHKKGWERQIEMNLKVENNLEKIINTLESGDRKVV